MDEFFRSAESSVDRKRPDLDAAEARRLSFKPDSAEISLALERLSGELAEWVMHFATLAGRPVTLRNPRPA